MDDLSLEEARRKHALELACDNFKHSGIATNTAHVLQQAKEFEDFLKVGQTSAAAEEPK